MLLDLLQRDPTAFVILALCLVMSLTLHEWGHAFTADRLGDSTPRRFGRVTLNPLKHLDPIGTLLLLFVGFGFAKPVPVNGARVGRWGMLAVAAAGPIMNIAVAVVCLIALRLVGDNLLMLRVLLPLLGINVVLAVFNLLPIPLLDGSRIVAALFPRSLGRALAEFEMQPFSFVLVMIFIYIAREPIFQIVRTVQGFALNVAGFA
ncbi:site-2 protease family protein [Deinococcus peraridilitoris]|uniref:Zn-dependent protease n=1 Tax=Deinococcus peraridilitoris (strain DSM 19664 / LMG 22246 / CIP 109416 / KR-200) TaxID=937777 RepID=K9ZWB5_DEIPD|nr:site-2 protease family protein [Deinococcus peraridilitoris]AFZ65933.1 Zn-dependent protease [Deinococcus peraridilitoris DSM 19664]